MLQHGSRVTAVEPSPNFANAVRETGEVNCWADRLTVHNARVHCRGHQVFRPGAQQLRRSWMALGKRPIPHANNARKLQRDARRGNQGWRSGSP